MVAGLLSKGVKVFHWLRKFVSQNGWRIPHTRLVLLNVYVRSVLQYGAPVWASAALDVSFTRESPVLRPMLV